MDNQLIKVTTNEKRQQLASARELHKFLEISSNFTTWFKRMCEYGFEENVDFTEVWNDSKKGSEVCFQKSSNYMSSKKYFKDYKITIDMAKQLCRITRKNPKSAELLKYLYKINSNLEPIIKEQPRKEYQFGEMLDKITGLKWEKQYPIDGGKYRLDFYLENILIIEYDEDQHNCNKEKDNKRMIYCRDWLANNEGDCSDWRCPVIRVKMGEELEGLNRIIRHIAGFEEFDTQYNYKLEVCDYDNK